MALTRPSWSLRPHPLPMGPAASFKLQLQLQLHHGCAWPWTLLFCILTYTLTLWSALERGLLLRAHLAVMGLCR